MLVRCMGSKLKLQMFYMQSLTLRDFSRALQNQRKKWEISCRVLHLYRTPFHAAVPFCRPRFIAELCVSYLLVEIVPGVYKVRIIFRIGYFPTRVANFQHVYLQITIGIMNSDDYNCPQCEFSSCDFQYHYCFFKFQFLCEVLTVNK